MPLGNLRFWHVRSRWDYFAFIAVIQWTFAGAAVLAAGSGAVYEPLAGVAILALATAVLLSYIAPLVVLATWLGSRHHDHLSPTATYHLAAIFLGPLVGVHYLIRTGQAD